MNESATIECPWCLKNLPIPPEAIGQRVSCPCCSGKFVAEAPAGPGGSQPASTQERGDPESAASLEMSAVALLIIGAILMLIAAILGYRSVFRPWDAMRRLEPTVACSLTERFFAVFIAVLAAGVMGWGVLKLVLRKKYAAKGRRLTIDPVKIGQVAGLLTAVAAIVPYFKLNDWYDGQIEALGYKKVDRMAKYSPTLPPATAAPKPPSWQDIDRLMRRPGPGEELEKLLDERERKTRDKVEFWKELEKQFREKRREQP